MCKIYNYHNRFYIHHIKQNPLFELQFFCIQNFALKHDRIPAEQNVKKIQGFRFFLFPKNYCLQLNTCPEELVTTIIHA